MALLTLSLLTPCKSFSQTIPTNTIESKNTSCLAMVIAQEAGGSTVRDMHAVGHVTLNRVANPKFPKTICDVVYQPGQFSWAKHPHYFKNTSKIWEQSYNIATQILVGEKDETNGALYFHVISARPHWYGLIETLRTKVHSYLK